MSLSRAQKCAFDNGRDAARTKVPGFKKNRSRPFRTSRRAPTHKSKSSASGYPAPTRSLTCAVDGARKGIGQPKLTSKSQSSILPNTPCFPNFSVVTLGLEIPNATRARNLASSLTPVAASMALIFFSSMRPFLERWSRAWRNLTGVLERQKLQCRQPSVGTVSSSPKCRASSRLEQPGWVTRSITCRTRAMSLFSLDSICA